MHSAPAVSFPVGRSRFQGWLLGLTGLGATLAGLQWHLASNAPAGWRQALFAMTLLGACVFAAHDWRRSPRGSLRWDGQAWSWTRNNKSSGGVLTVHLDLQFCLVVSLRPHRGARIWLWPERETEVALWNALRRAVFARRAAGQGQDVHTPAHRDKADS